MSVAFTTPRDPRAIPEHVLWTLRKGDRTAEARVRMAPGGPELRVYVSRLETGALELHWSQVFRALEGGGAVLGERAELTRVGVRDASVVTGEPAVSGYVIGTGVGPRFSECVALYTCATTRRGLRSPDSFEGSSGGTRAHARPSGRSAFSHRPDGFVRPSWSSC